MRPSSTILAHRTAGRVWELRRSRRRGRALAVVGLVAIGLVGSGVSPRAAAASVRGKRGVEIETNQDRRGFYGGFGVGVLTNVFVSPAGLAPAPMFSGHFGGGVSQRLLIGANVFVAPYLSPQLRGSVAVGGDAELTGFVVKGLFLRLGAGVAAVPQAWDRRPLTAGVGARPAIGYEFWLNQSAAMELGLAYDIRVTPELQPRHGVALGVRVSFY